MVPFSFSSFFFFNFIILYSSYVRATTNKQNNRIRVPRPLPISPHFITFHHSSDPYTLASVCFPERDPCRPLPGTVFIFF